LGGTRILAGTKVVLGEPMHDLPNQGSFSVSAELLPLAHEEYETGPPKPEAIELARVVDRGIRAGNCIDLEDLFIEEGKVWSIYVDLYVLNYAGNLFDASALAAMSAIMTTRVPKYEDGKEIREDRSRRLKINNIVTTSTFGKIGKTILLDLDENEDTASDARITIATDDEVIRASQKGLRGSFSSNEIEMMLDKTFEKRKELKRHLEKVK
ncbi:MAG: exosome complex protein Rrp42, partial [Candidatus Micrarchaeaceae archaeon]